MLNKISGWFGLSSLKESQTHLAKYIASERSNTQNVAIIQKFQEREKNLKTELFLAKQKTSLPHPVVGMDVGDTSPIDSKERKMYVGQVAGFHKDVQQKKIVSMISEMREQFEKKNRDTFGYTQADYDLFLKGTINGLWLMHDWGETMVNEQLSYQVDDDGLNKGEVQGLKDKLKE